MGRVWCGGLDDKANAPGNAADADVMLNAGKGAKKGSRRRVDESDLAVALLGQGISGAGRTLSKERDQGKRHVLLFT